MYIVRAFFIRNNYSPMNDQATKDAEVAESDTKAKEAEMAAAGAHTDAAQEHEKTAKGQ